ncbi:hypothetical protein HDV00_004390 [Rhizophlyctis rosea]|nr:hypothetical protein HDV00_004390 [Rhizophlyctis rosea]
MSPLITAKHRDIYPLIDPSDPSSGLNKSASGRPIIITGAGRGIGRSIALNYARANAATIVIASRTTSELDSLEKEINTINPAIKVIKQTCDVTKEWDVRRLITAAASSPDTDTPFTLVNNAGYGDKSVSIADTDPAGWKKTWDVNVNGIYLTTRYLLPHLSTTTKQKNYIINISSAGSRLTTPGLNAYQSSKTAVNRFTEFLQLEHGSTHNLVAFAVHPGEVMTDLARDVVPESYHHLLSMTPDVMGGFAVWLGSGKCDWAGGRYLEAAWDVGDILAAKEKVVDSELWKTVVLL